MKNKKFILIASVLLVICMLTGCGNATSQTSTNTQKLALTKENIQKVFKDEYGISIYDCAKE